MHPIRFTATTAWATVMNDFDTATRCEVYDAIFHYAATGEQPRLTREAAVAFAFIRMDLDQEAKRAEEKRERNRRNGALGGRAPRKHKAGTPPPEADRETETSCPAGDDDDDDETNYFMN